MFIAIGLYSISYYTKVKMVNFSFIDISITLLCAAEFLQWSGSSLLMLYFIWRLYPDIKDSYYLGSMLFNIPARAELSQAITLSLI